MAQGAQEADASCQKVDTGQVPAHRPVVGWSMGKATGHVRHCPVVEHVAQSEGHETHRFSAAERKVPLGQEVTQSPAGVAYLRGSAQIVHRVAEVTHSEHCVESHSGQVLVSAEYREQCPGSKLTLTSTIDRRTSIRKEASPVAYLNASAIFENPSLLTSVTAHILPLRCDREIWDAACRTPSGASCKVGSEFWTVVSILHLQSHLPLAGSRTYDPSM